MTTSEEEVWYLDSCLKIMEAAAPQRVELVAALCDRLDVNEIDTINPVSMFVETAISQGFLAAYAAEDFRLALRFAEVASQVAQRLPDFEMGCARTASNRALALMELGEFVEARNLFEKALQIAATQKDPFGLASTIRSNISAMEGMRSGRVETAAIWTDTQSMRSESTSSRNNRALTLLQAGRYREACVAFKALSDDAENSGILTRATLLSNMAGAERGSGEIDKARATLELAMRECDTAGYNGQVLAGILYEYGELLIRHGTREDRARAGDQFKRGWDIIRHITPRSRQSLLILNSLARVRLASQDSARACAALDRGMELYDEMRASVGTTEEELSGLFEIYRQLVELRLWLVPERDDPLEAALLIQKAKARYWGETLARRRGISTSDDQVGLDSDDDFRHLVGFDGTMLEFFVGPNATFVCLIHNRHIAVYRIDVTEEQLADQVDAACIRLSSGLQASRQLAALSSTVLGKLSPDWERNRAILIAPDGPLWRAPIWLLRLPGQNRSLEEIAPCFCIPSAGVLAQMRRQRKPAAKHAGLIVAHAQAGPTNLPGSDEEVRFVRESMVGLGNVVVLGEHGDAAGHPSPERVPSMLSETTHVHFTAHAVGGNADQEAHILLSTEDGSGQALLTASQIERLHLSTELVVLATCESSLGYSRPGEGLASLARAFLLAGARCVIATLWEIDNRSAREYFRLFYSFIARGEAPARSYRLAKQHYETQSGRDATSVGIVVLGDADSDKDRQDLRHIEMNQRDE